MYQRDWLDDLSWGAIGIGGAVALVLQVALTLLVLQPLGISLTWSAAVLVELCIALGAFVAGWRARHAAVINGLAAALLGAAISLLATVARAPREISVLGILFLFGTFALMGALGGLVAGRMRARQAGS
jgi:putative membrane protein (TIGR04086 family)